MGGYHRGDDREGQRPRGSYVCEAGGTGGVARLIGWKSWHGHVVVLRTWLASSEGFCSRVETRSFLLAVISTYPHATPLNLAAISKI